MKLIRFGEKGTEKAGVQWNDTTRLDVSSFGEDYTPTFFATNGIERLSTWLEQHHEQLPVLDDSVRIAPPISTPSKIICVGLNYGKHAAESGMELPKEPVLFFKATSAIVGPYDNIRLPQGSLKTDWEVELAFVIGKKTAYVSEEEAMDYVAGYMIHNDVSERAFQLERSGQWVKGKSCDTFAPIGPVLVTKDEIADPHQLNLWLKVNDELMQNSNTSDLVFGIPTLVSYISRFMTLLPGDVISTGTPSGVGMGLKPQRFLKAGDVVELGIQGLESAKQTVVEFSL